VTWRFLTRDPVTGDPPQDPLAGFLPPDVTPPEGEGSVVFTVRSAGGLATGAQVSNRATIVFDANDPIDTPQWVNTLDATPPTSQVDGVDAADCSATDLPVRWSGTDVGSGIQGYTVFVSEDGGPASPIVSATDATSAPFTGQLGRTYAFYSVARDFAGNEESPPA